MINFANLESEMQLKVAVKHFLQFCAVERRLSPHTVQAYEFDLADFSRWIGSPTLRRGVSTGQLKDYLQYMVVERKLAPSTVRRRLACLRSFFRFTLEGKKAKSPFDGWQLKLPRRKRLPRCLSKAEALCLLSPPKRARGARGTIETSFAVLIRLMVSTGLRVGEVCRLLTEDISLDGTMIRVKGKGSKERVAYITDDRLLHALKKLRIQRGATPVPLFINLRGTAMKPQSVRLRLRKIAQEVGLERRITPHMLRHTAATLLIETGVDIRFVQRLLGHSSISTTEIYTHVSDEALRNTLARANILSSIAAH
jgi:site-specific recombinase XerD